MTTATLSDQIRNGVEPVDIYDTDGELDGYALAIAPQWWVSLRRGYAEITDSHIQRLQREVVAGAVKVIGPTVATYSSAWDTAANVRYIPGEGFAYRAQQATQPRKN